MQARLTHITPSDSQTNGPNSPTSKAAIAARQNESVDGQLLPSESAMNEQ